MVATLLQSLSVPEETARCIEALLAIIGYIIGGLFIIAGMLLAVAVVACVGYRILLLCLVILKFMFSLIPLLF